MSGKAGKKGMNRNKANREQNYDPFFLMFLFDKMIPFEYNK